MTYIAFNHASLIRSGTLHEVAAAARHVLDEDPRAQVLLFDDETSATVEVDFRGRVEDVLGRLSLNEQIGAPVPAPAEYPTPRGPGRPKLGVVAREVTLLPRHWEWLATQRGGASVALRKLVEDARRADDGSGKVRLRRDAAYKFMSAMAGNERGFEDAARALYASDVSSFEHAIACWPGDVRRHALRLAMSTFPPAGATA